MKKICVALFLLAAFCMPVYAKQSVNIPDENPMFILNIYGVDDRPYATNNRGVYQTVIPAFNFTTEQVDTLEKGAEAWTKIINPRVASPSANVTIYANDEYNASASSPEVKTETGGVEDTYTRTWMNALINGKRIINAPKDNQATVIVGLGVAEEDPGWANYVATTPLPQQSLPELYVVVAHELGHALGIACYTSPWGRPDGTGYVGFSEKLSIYDAGLRVMNTIDGVKTEISAQEGTSGMMIEFRNAANVGNNVFNITENAPYFVGTNVNAVLVDAVDKATGKGLVNYSGQYSGLGAIVYGVPITGVEGSPELSHIELRNSYMSHQEYRNWNSFMEAEVALLQDLGYDIDRGELFGKSYYQNDAVETYNSTFTDKSKDFAIGIHIYGDKNEITQTGTISTTGAASVGVRIEGEENKFTTSGNIENTGTNGAGIIASWGKGHNIKIDSGSSVSATGSGGIGAIFDFGKNISGEFVSHKGSYINTQGGKDIALKPELEGALVERFDISGTLEGKKTAIYISDNAWVKDINVQNNAQINGDIISNWNSVTSGKYSNVQAPGSDLLFTNLNFGENASDTISYSDDITAKDSMKMNVKAGTLTYDKGKAELYDVNVGNAPGGLAATLTGSAVYDLKNVFFINETGTYTSAYGAGIKAARIENNGTMNILGKFNLGANVIADSGTLNGIINVGTDSTNKGYLDVSSIVNKIDNTVTVFDGSVFSTMNDNSQNLTVKEYVAKGGSKFAFDLGDTFNFDAIDPANNSSVFSQIKVDEEKVKELVAGTNIFDLFNDKNKALELTGNANFIYNGTKYTFTQDTVDKNLNVTKDASGWGIADAVASGSTANYIVLENEIKNHGIGKASSTALGTVQGQFFEITGADVNLDEEYNGLIIDGVINTQTVLKTGIVNAEIDDATGYKGAITLNNAGKLTVDSSGKNIKISSANKDTAIYLEDIHSKVTLESVKQITVDGKIQGQFDNITGTYSSLHTDGNFITLNGVDTLHIEQDASTLNLVGQSRNVDWTLSHGTLYAQKDQYLAGGTNVINFDGGDLSLINNQASLVDLKQMTVSNNANLYLDLDLKNQTMDRLGFNNKTDLNAASGQITIQSINFVNPNTALTNERYDIAFINSSLNNTNLLDKISTNTNQNVLTPIFKYDFRYNKTNEEEFFRLSRPGGSAQYGNLNPSIMAGPVAAQVGSYLTQLNTYEQAFNNMDMTMLMSAQKRSAMKLANKYAAVGEGANLGTFSPNQIPEQSKGLWFKPYAAFESVGLSGGPKVSNTAYGSLFGGDSPIIELKHGWDLVYSGYAGYTGSNQTYDGVSINQNGGTLGATAVLYKNNFFTGLTANTGANSGQASTMYGQDNFTMLVAGVASKSGYNWELFNSKFILQPNFLMSYTFVNTFDYNTASGVKVDSDPLNAIQIAPGLKFIGNLKYGWQPYASVQMVWNVMDKTKFSANDVSLPELSIHPYIQYGVGVQKRWSERFTAFGQTMLRNGGRNGIALQFGFRWTI